MTVDGGTAIDQKNDKVVWATLFKLLEQRMQNGEFTVIDATNSKTIEMNRYKELCDNHKYRIYCVDFTDIPIEVVKARNAGREPLKRVPDEVIDKMYSRFATQKIPSGITVISPNELDRIWLKKIDLSQYKRIHVFGDIHGCNTALQEYLNANGGILDDEFYLFTGDYIDRGIENVEVIQFLFSIYECKNVLLLEGNHERWLWLWANNAVAQSKEFECSTKTQIENARIDKKAIRKMYRRFGQCAYFSYYGNDYLVTHGGLSCLPENLTLVSTMQMIKGVGGYNDYEQVENNFTANTAANCYQIHAHRNTKHLPIIANERNFNLEGSVEFGGDLRVLRLTPDGNEPVCIHNTIYRPPEERVEYRTVGHAKNVADMILELRQNKYVQEKRYGNISSFNFTKQAFFDKIWDEQTTRARGLFINIPKAKIVARSYDKFFNVNERPETKFDMLQHTLQFPVTAYVKENGFLGIAAWNEEDDGLFVTTKSNPDGDYAVWLRANMENLLGPAKMEKIRLYSKEHNVSFVFECVDMIHDPHVIQYESPCALYLLDVIYNETAYRKLSFEELCAVAAEISLLRKERAFVIDSWQEFFDWYYRVTDEDYLYHGRHIEGFVIEDALGKMVKLKLSYYNFWKYMRGIAHEAIRNGYINGKRTASLTTPLANQFYGWARTLHDREDRDAIPKDICTLRSMFYQTEIGKQFAD